MGQIKQFNEFLIMQSGDLTVLFNSETNFTKELKLSDLSNNCLKQQANPNSMNISRNGQFLAVSYENKQVVIYKLFPDLEIIKNFTTHRLASQVTFTGNNDILVADKTGDVYLYSSDSDKSEPTLLLGHLSMILDIEMSECGKFVVTCDRDEKIRVSHFPNCYNIKSYCLGHTEFVITVKVVGDLIISASGDGTVRLWNFDGKQVGIINVNTNLGKLDFLEEFCKEMDKEKVEVTALPITDMQVYNNDDIVFVAVSLFRFPGIQLYKIKTESLEINYVKTIEVKCNYFTFSLAKQLFVLTSENLSNYSMDKLDSDEPKIVEFYKKYKHFLTNFITNDIQHFYKRKFDNVQEYLEKKKIRLQMK